MRFLPTNQGVVGSNPARRASHFSGTATTQEFSDLPWSGSRPGTKLGTPAAATVPVCPIVCARTECFYRVLSLSFPFSSSSSLLFPSVRMG